jgi:surface polysaccharide O-acyltransferase-like enzyme
MKDNNKRVAYADIARISASFAVVLLHTAGIRMVKSTVESSAFFWSAIFDSFARWSVPLFIMLSGMLFLNREGAIDVKRLWKKNIFRLVTAFLFWSYLYNLYAAISQDGLGGKMFLTALLNTPNGAMHLWFIFVIIGLYIVTPFVKRMTDNMTKREAEYFLILNLVITFIPKTLSCFATLKPYTSYLNNFEISYAAGYIGFFVAGWYIEKFEHGKKFRACVYALAVASYAYTSVMTIAFSRAKGEMVEDFMSFKSVTAYLMAFGFLMFLKYAFREKEFGRRGLSNLKNWSKYTFGVYLIHEMILSIMSAKGWDILMNCSYIGIPIQAAVVFLISYIIAAAIDFTPLGKYII